MNCGSGGKKGPKTQARSNAEPTDPPTEQQPLLSSPMEAEPSLESNPPVEPEDAADAESDGQVPA